MELFFVGEPSSAFKKANIFSMSKATTENDRNLVNVSATYKRFSVMLRADN